MNTVSSPPSEPFLLARRGLPLAGSARPSAPANWLVSYGFARARVTPPDAPAATGRELASCTPGEMPVAPGETRPWPDAEAAPGRVSMDDVRRAAAIETPAAKPPPAAQAGKDPAHADSMAHPGLGSRSPSGGAPNDDPPAQRAGSARADPIAKAAGPRMSLGTEPAAPAQPASRNEQIIPHAPLDLPQIERLPVKARAPSRPLDDPSATGAHPRVRPEPSRAVPTSPPAEQRAEMTGKSLRHFARHPQAAPGEPAMPAEIDAPAFAPRAPAQRGGAGARLAAPMGAPGPAAPRPAPIAAALPPEIARLAERSRASYSAGAGRRVTYRIDTVHVVVKSPTPSPGITPSGPALPASTEGARAREPAHRGFRNPWTSYARRIE